MTQKPFIFHYLQDGKLNQLDEDLKNIQVIDLELGARFSKFNLIDKYKLLIIPTLANNLVDQFCTKYNCHNIKIQLINLLCGIQENYKIILFVKEHSDSALFNGIENERKDLGKLLNLLEDFYYNDENKIKEIKFFTNTESISVKNLIVVKDILRSIGFNFNLEKLSKPDFDKKLSELIDSTNDLQYNKLEKIFRKKACELLKSLLIKYFSSERECHRNIGAFMHISQFFPINNSQNFLKSPKFEDYLSETSPEYIYNILNRKVDDTLL